MPKKQSHPTTILNKSNVDAFSLATTKSRDGTRIRRRSRARSFGSASSSLSSLASSITSCTDDKQDLVYVRDDVYAWVPAEVQSSTSDSLSTEVKVILPDDWAETTILYDESTIKELEYKLNSSHSKNGYTITSPQFGRGANCRRHFEHRPGKRTYNYEKKKRTKSAQNGIMRSIVLDDYPNGVLPMQNIERHNRRNSNFDNMNDNSSDMLVNARDMADLPFLHEAAVLYNIKLRNKKMMPYTRVGDIMVAVNPFSWIKGLYSSENQALYAQYLIWGVIKKESRSSIKNPPKILEDGSTYSDSNATVSTRHRSIEHGSYYSKLGLEPHIFETASLAYSGLSSAQQNQTILVSGESGAGKTETVKIVMTNLATLEHTRALYPFTNDALKSWDRKREEGAQGIIVRRVLESNPLFEAFGNAKTCRNHNSSRFGRFTQLQFDVESLADAAQNGRGSVPRCTLAGGVASTYLLEKSRVVHHSVGERNYHIFYQLLASSEDEKIAIWDGLAGKTNESFLYVGSSSINFIEGKSDGQAWNQTRDALKLFGFKDNNFYDLMRALCVVLQLGNLQFELPEGSIVEEGGSIISPEEELVKLSTLMGISCEDIIKAMTMRAHTIRGEKVVMKLSPKDAKEGCDALAKEVYSLVFGILVCQINECTSPSNIHMHGGKPYDPGSTFGTISLLDIFGFESFENNRFEQLCINYANERLQQKYVFDNFNTAREEYASEGIEVFDFSIVDNSDVVTLLEGNGRANIGLITVLNEECTRPNGSDIAFVHKLKNLLGESSRLLDDNLHGRYEFGIMHFAGHVTYDSYKFLQSNSDRIPDDLVECASRSINNVIGKGFSAIATMNKTNQMQRRSLSSKRTVLSKFRSQLSKIIQTIESTRTRYIRCIKPNTSMLPGVTDHIETMRQLLSAGLVTAITISRETFPNYLYYDVAWDRFQCLYKLKMGSVEDCTINFQIPLRLNSTSTKQRKKKDGRAQLLKQHSEKQAKIKAAVEKMLSCLLVTPFVLADGARVPMYACGKTKVYFRVGALESLESDRLEYYSIYATIIQAWYMSQVSRVKFNQLKYSIISLQAKSRGRKVRLEYHHMKYNVIKIQAKRRGKVAQSSYILSRNAVIFYQKNYRGSKARSDFLKLKNATTISQKWRRRRIAIRNFRRLQLSALTIQTKRRGKVARLKYFQMQFAVIIVQKFIRKNIAQSQYTTIRNATLVIQPWIRGKIVFMNYRRLQLFIILIQTLRRGKVVRSRFLQMKKAATLLQRFSRLHLAQFKLKCMKHAAVYIQTWIRMNMQRRKYNRLQLAIISFQARKRGKVVRSKYLFMQRAAIVLQKATRLKAARSLYIHKKNVIMFIQTWARGKVLFIQYRQLHHSTIFIQAQIRGKFIRTRYLIQKSKIVNIQSWIRMEMLRQKYRRLHIATVTLQARRRGKVARSNLREQCAAIVLQNAFRLKAEKSRFLSIKYAVVYIQSWIRMQTYLQRYRNFQCSVIAIQSFARGKIIRSMYQRMQCDAIIKHYAVLRIQSRIRMYLLLQKYNSWQISTILIQRTIRGKVIRSMYLRMQCATIILQNTLRRKAAQSQFLNMKHASVCIQSWIRMHILCQRYKSLQVSIIIIQTFVRVKVIRPMYLRMQFAAIVLQKVFRRKAAQSQFLNMKHASVGMQSWIRMHILCQRYKSLQVSMIIIQTFVRVKVMRSMYLRMQFAAIVLQKVFRRKAAQSQFLNMKHASVCMQSWIRMHILCQRYKSLQVSMIIIQTFVRGKVMRSMYLRMQCAAIVLQKVFRRKAARSQYISRKYGVLCIQTWTRMEMSRQKYRRLQIATVTFQARRRGKIARSQYLREQCAAILLQANIRGNNARVKYLNELFRIKASSSSTDYSTDSFSDKLHQESSQSVTSIKHRNARNYLTVENSALSLQVQENYDLTAVIKELEDDKQDLLYHAKALETECNMTKVYAQELAGINSSLVSEASALRRANAKLENDIWLVKREKNEMLLSVRQNAMKVISQQDIKIRSLKETGRLSPSNQRREVLRLTEKLNQHNEFHLDEVRTLKEKINKITSYHQDYLNQLTDSLEASYSARETEVGRLKTRLNEVQIRKDEEIRNLKEEIASLQDSSSIDAVYNYHK